MSKRQKRNWCSYLAFGVLGVVIVASTGVPTQAAEGARAEAQSSRGEQSSPALPDSAAPAAPDTQVGTAFTYQGQLKRSGGAYSGTCDFRFGLWNASGAGNQQAGTLNKGSIAVANGLFAVELDFGNQFTGDARWLEIAVQCAGDGSFTTLSPRVALTSSPYSLSLMPGAYISGSIPGTTGIVRGVNMGPGAAFVGIAGSTTGTTYGVLGNAFSPTGNAVYGYGTNNATGVRGEATGGGRGVWGSSVSWHGVYGESRDNVGVLGLSKYFDGVWGETEADNAVGVIGFGKDKCPTPTSCLGTAKRNATGVAGEAFAYGFGTWGRSKFGTGAYGETSAAHTFDLAGVVGVSTGEGGIGVKGVADVGGGAYGVYGVSAAGYGVVGKSTTGYAGYFIGKVGISGGSDLAERFDVSGGVSGGRSEPGTLMIVDEDHPGQLKPSAEAYDTRVVGVVSGAGGVRPGLTLHQDGALDGSTEIAVAGRVYVKAEAHGAPIKPGDLLTTSDLPGYAMKAADRERAYGAVIGKALTGLASGEGLVLVLVNLQ